MAAAGEPTERPAPEPREQENSDWVVGRRPVFEVFEANKRTVHKLHVVQGTGGGVIEQILEKARERGVPIEWTKFEWLDRVVQGHHQGIAAQVSATEYQELEPFLEKLGPTADAVFLALDEIQDPQNLGAMLRSAGFFGVTAAIVPRWRSAPVSDAAVRASSGAVEHVPLIRVQNLSDALLQLKDAAFDVVGADMTGEPAWQRKPSPRTVLVMGSEGSGLRRLVRDRCDRLVGIPRRSAVDSLNVAAATAIFLYEFFRGK
jgi:23S rRNA (guanosine2251-2'-O)-methyltransferase